VCRAKTYEFKTPGACRSGRKPSLPFHSRLTQMTGCAAFDRRTMRETSAGMLMRNPSPMYPVPERSARRTGQSCAHYTRPMLSESQLRAQHTLRRCPPGSFPGRQGRVEAELNSTLAAFFAGRFRLYRTVIKWACSRGRPGSRASNQLDSSSKRHPLNTANCRRDFMRSSWGSQAVRSNR